MGGIQALKKVPTITSNPPNGNTSFLSAGTNFTFPKNETMAAILAATPVISDEERTMKTNRASAL